MTEKLSSSNPSWGPCMRKNKTKKNNRRTSWGPLTTLTWSRRCFRAPSVQSLWFQNQIVRTVASRRPGAAPTPSVAASHCLKDIAKARFPPFGAVYGGSSGSKLSIVNTKREGRRKTYWVLLSTSNWSSGVGEGGGTSFYLPGWGEFQRRGGGAVSWGSSPQPAALVWKLAYCHVWLKLFFFLFFYSSCSLKKISLFSLWSLEVRVFDFWWFRFFFLF